MKSLSISLSPDIALSDELLRIHICKLLNTQVNDKVIVRKIKQSIDARKKEIVVHLELSVYINESPENEEKLKFEYKHLSNAKSVIVVGSGPAGLFAALRLIELNVKPIVIERGKM